METSHTQKYNVYTAVYLHKYIRDATLPLFQGIPIFSNTRLNLKKHHRSIHNIRLQMIIDIQVFEFSNTCTVRASMAVVRLTAMEALILSVTVYIDPSPQPTAGKQPCARIPTGHCLRTNGISEWMPTVSDSPSARSPTATNEPQAELHSVHSFLYFPIGTIIIGLLCTSYKNWKRYKQGAGSLLVADWSKIGHLNK